MGVSLYAQVMGDPKKAALRLAEGDLGVGRPRLR
jgi:hypothetical protein